MDVQPPGRIERKGPQENGEKSAAEQHRSVEPPSGKEEEAQEQFRPGQNDGGQIDQARGQDLIVVNNPGKRGRMKDLVRTRRKEDDSQKDSDDGEGNL